MILTKEQKDVLRRELRSISNDYTPRVIFEWDEPVRESTVNTYRLVFTGTKYQVQKQDGERLSDWSALDPGLGIILLGKAVEGVFKLENQR